MYGFTYTPCISLGLLKEEVGAPIDLLADRSYLLAHHCGDGRGESVCVVSTAPALRLEHQYGGPALSGD
ncbi:protein of unknown function [Nitrospira japonica]|uniref:Uncharacterized protein n=1 Tax=Nitrospira japonica TaxID=1325564 RepID=A0A1W1I7K9_9BACT|nr:protein of unknown function [Nitrospira japonica]